MTDLSSKIWSPTDLDHMISAIAQAELGPEHNDVPVGAVIVDDLTGEIIAASHNTREKEGSVLGHAEINAITQACRLRHSWQLTNCTLYVTLEPCPMCAGAILAARIPRVIFGAKDPVAGAMGSVWSLHEHPIKSPHTIVESGCLPDKTGQLLKDFFKSKRE